MLLKRTIKRSDIDDVTIVHHARDEFSGPYDMYFNLENINHYIHSSRLHDRDHGLTIGYADEKVYRMMNKFKSLYNEISIGYSKKYFLNSETSMEDVD